MNPYRDNNGVPYNVLGLADKDELRKQEYQLTHIRGKQLIQTPIPGEFDLVHLRAIHRHIFQDVYAWAGKLRTVNISKGTPERPGWKGVFTPAHDIEAKAAAASEFSATRGQLKGLSKDEFVETLAQLYTQWNEIHPFPEGNGRSTLAMLSQLSREAGQRLDFNRIGSEQWKKAAAASMPQTHIEQPHIRTKGDMRGVRDVFHRIVVSDRNSEVQQPHERALER